MPRAREGHLFRFTPSARLLDAVLYAGKEQFLMQVIHQRCAGIDIHKKMVVVTVLITLVSGQVQKFTRTFSTMTTDLLALADWLDSLQVVQIAMESAGVFTPSQV